MAWFFQTSDSLDGFPEDRNILTLPPSCSVRSWHAICGDAIEISGELSRRCCAIPWSVAWAALGVTTYPPHLMNQLMAWEDRSVHSQRTFLGVKCSDPPVAPIASIVNGSLPWRRPHDAGRFRRWGLGLQP
jgi:hypothetical protein